MVLKSSDYTIPSTGSSWNPLSVSTYRKLAGAAIAVGMVGTAAAVGWNEIRPRAQRLLGRLTGGRVDGRRGEGTRVF